MFHTFILQEEIKILSVTIFVNPYTEPDEGEEQDNAKEKNAEDEDNVCSRIFEISLAVLSPHFCNVFLLTLAYLSG